MARFLKNMIWAIRQLFAKKPGEYDGVWEDWERSEQDYHEFWEDIEEDKRTGDL